MPKVTVVVPTYRSSHHLDELVASVDRQTMPQEDIEVLLIDDGSPDDTAKRLRAFAATRPNYRVFELPPSGWPSRPRNHGIDEARGEFIAFIDHDDRLYPDALRAAYDLATRTGADVVDGKESKSNTPGWAMRDVDHDVENAIDWTDTHPLLPMNPHKFFRTQFLRDKHVRFPEGGRQIWEDIAFDIAAHARAEVVSLMVETPYYLWNRTPTATTSASFHDDLGEYLDAVSRVFTWIEDDLRQPRFAELYPRFLAYQLHMRVLTLFSGAARSDADQERIRAFVTDLLPRISRDADAHLDPWRRIKVALLRAGRFDLVPIHEATMPRLRVAPTVREPVWTGEGLDFSVEVEWRSETQTGSAVRYRDGRVVLELAPEISDFAKAAGLSDDVTDLLPETGWSLERRSRSQKVDWAWARGNAPSITGGIDPLMTDTIRVQWRMSEDGRLHDSVWDAHLRSTFMRTRVVRPVKAAFSDHRWAVVAGRLAVAYRSQAGNLAVDVGEQVMTAADEAPQPPRAVPGSHGHGFVLTLPHVEVHGDVDIAGRLVTRSGRVVGSCRATVGGSGLEIRGDAPTRKPFSIQLGGVPSRTLYSIDRRGRVRTGTAEPPRWITRVRTARPGWLRAVWHRLPSRVRRAVLRRGMFGIGR